MKIIYKICLASVFAVNLAKADEIKVVSAAAVQSPVMYVAEEFEKRTGHKIIFTFATAGGVDDFVKKANAGSKPDLIFNLPSRLVQLASEGHINSTPPLALGVVRIGIAAREGAPKPDLSSLEGFKNSLLKINSVSYGDPAKGPTTGIHFAKVLEQLGIKTEVNAKAQLVTNGLEVMKLVKEGKADYGVTQISEIIHVAPNLLVGPLPEAVQLKSTYSASFGNAQPSLATQEFLKALLSEKGKEKFKAAGFE